MNRTKIVEAILNNPHASQSDSLMESLKFLTDTNLLSLAITLGIDTDSILSQDQGGC